MGNVVEKPGADGDEIQQRTAERHGHWERLSGNDVTNSGERVRRVWVASVEVADRKTKKGGNPRLKSVSSFGSR